MKPLWKIAEFVWLSAPWDNEKRFRLLAKTIAKEVRKRVRRSRGGKRKGSALCKDCFES